MYMCVLVCTCTCFIWHVFHSLSVIDLGFFEFVVVVIVGCFVVGILVICFFERVWHRDLALGSSPSQAVHHLLSKGKHQSQHQETGYSKISMWAFAVASCCWASLLYPWGEKEISEKVKIFQLRQISLFFLFRFLSVYSASP